MNRFFTFSIAIAALCRIGRRVRSPKAKPPPNPERRDDDVSGLAGALSGGAAVGTVRRGSVADRAEIETTCTEYLGRLRSSPKGQHVVRIVLPLGVWLPNGVTIVAGKTKIDKVVVRRCEPFGCVVEGLLDAKLRDAMRGGGEAKIVVYDQTKKPLDLKFSLKGYVEAEDHMVAETKKAKPAAAAKP